VKSQSYIQKLEENNIFRDLDLLFGHKCYIFQQDGARPHTAAHSLGYFLQKEVLMLPPEAPWPACSPDLSPIEQVWGSMKHQINITAAMNSPKSFFEEIERIWLAIPMDTINNYMKTLKPRIWALEDLMGRPLTGRNDMIHEYEKGGIDARMRVRQMLSRSSISRGDSQQWFEMVAETMKEMSALGMNLEIHQRLEKLHMESERMRAFLPLKK
jgi:hypothetical protein